MASYDGAAEPRAGRSSVGWAGRRVGLAVLGVVALLVAIAVLALPRGGVDASLTHARRRGLRIGYAVEAPYAFVDARGEVTGESPAIARHVARALGVDEVAWVQTAFERLMPELEAGRFDVIASGLFVTAARAQRVAFSRPTFRVGSALLVRGDAGEVPRSCGELVAHPAMRVAVVAGAVEGERLRACGVSEAQLVVVPDAASGRTVVQTGMALGLALSGPTLRWMASSAGDVRVEPLWLGGTSAVLDYGAFAFRRRDRALREAWDAELARFLGTPAHRRLVAAFGFGIDESVDVGAEREPARSGPMNAERP